MVSPGGSPSVKATRRSAASALNGLIREGRVLSRSRPSNPSSSEPVLQKAFLPAPNAGLGLGRSPHDRVRADAIGGQQHDFSPPDVLPRRVAVLHHSLEPANSGGRNGEGFFPARIAQTRTSSPHRESHRGLKCQVRSTRSDKVENKSILLVQLLTEYSRFLPNRQFDVISVSLQVTEFLDQLLSL